MLRDLLYGTISRKIFFLFLGAAIFPVAVLSFIAVRDLSQLSITKNTDIIIHDLRERETLVQFEIAQYTTLLNMLLDTGGVISYLESSEPTQEAILEVQRDFYTAISNSPSMFQLRLINEDGLELIRLDQDLGLVEVVNKEKLQNKADRYYFQESIVISDEEFYISLLDLNKEGSPSKVEVPHKPVIRIAAPLFSPDGSRKGIMIANINAAELLKLFGAENALADEYKDAAFSLIDAKGFYLFSHTLDKGWSGPTNLDTKYNFYKEYPSLAEKVQQSPTTNQQIGEVLYITERIDLSPSAKKDEMMLVSTIPLSSITEESQDSTAYILTISVVTTTLVAILAYGVSRLVGDPLKQLSKEIEIIASGNFSHKISIKGKDEIGRLGRDFEKMATALREYRDYLEKKVESRTKRLETIADNMIGRELKMVQLKEKVEQLEDKLSNVGKDV